MQAAKAENSAAAASSAVEMTANCAVNIAGEQDHAAAQAQAKNKRADYRTHWKYREFSKINCKGKQELYQDLL